MGKTYFCPLKPRVVMKAQSVSFITKTNSLLLFPLLVASCYLTKQESIYMALATMDLVTESS